MKVMMTWKLHPQTRHETLAKFTAMKPKDEKALMGPDVKLIGRWHSDAISLDVDRQVAPRGSRPERQTVRVKQVEFYDSPRERAPRRSAVVDVHDKTGGSLVTQRRGQVSDLAGGHLPESRATQRAICPARG